MKGDIYKESIGTFPASIRKLSSLRTLCLTNLRLNDISIIGELVTLEILNIRDSLLEELPVEIGKLTNLIMFEFRNEQGELKRISAGVLSRLVQLEELHMLGVEHFSYSTLTELESLSRLTAMTLSDCSGDVIYSNLALSSKLARYALTVGRACKATSITNNYDRIIVLEVTETCPLEYCFQLFIISALCSRQLPITYFNKLVKLRVFECKKLRNLMSPSVAKGVLNLRILKIGYCESMEEVITEEEQHGEEVMPLFPLLEKLELCRLPRLGHFFLTKHALKFLFLKAVEISNCPEMETFVQQGYVSIPSLESVKNDDEVKRVDLNKAMFNSKISCPNLEKLYINGANSITALCSDQLPNAYFSKLEVLYIWNCGKLRNLMSPSVARGVLNLRILAIRDCLSMEEVITKEEQQGERILTLFPLLEKLELYRAPKLAHFFLTECALEIPCLEEVRIHDCPEMKTFIKQETSVSTPCLKSVNNDYRVKVGGLNIWTQQRFNSKVCLVPLSL
ncbi:hypothetical protein MTR67_023398 [Solanum verrucosum]|uniref:Uncharacterized protein n=1 Tax=Solanum verrucosum TaxID=315347 RepID=A0AAF0QVE2_SOLVR|nr:hypothetical protein MTR67_023398 [Solanum verrucosum]